MKLIRILSAMLFLGIMTARGQTTFVPEDPWRIINGATNSAAGPGWYQFQGDVMQVTSKGIIVYGTFWTIGDPDWDNYKSVRFLIKNYPYDVADGDHLSWENNHTAFSVGTYSYTTVLDSTATIHAFDYGTIWTPPAPKPLSPEEIAAAKKKHDDAIAAAKAAAKAVGANAALKYNEDQAALGDAYGELRMGERYRDGDGVEKDLAKAKDYLAKSAVQGNTQAQAELKQLQ